MLGPAAQSCPPCGCARMLPGQAASRKGASGRGLHRAPSWQGSTKESRLVLSPPSACGAWAGSLLLARLTPDLLLLFALRSCSARLPWLDTSMFSSFTGASGSGQQRGSNVISSRGQTQRQPLRWDPACLQHQAAGQV